MMHGLSELFFLWPAKAIAGTRRRMRDALLDPFELLHRINWSAPWLERKMCTQCDD